MIISFDIENKGLTELEFLSTDMQVLFSRLQVMCGSVVVEDHTQNFNRLTTLLNKYQSTDKMLKQNSMQLGARQTMTATEGAALFAVIPQLFSAEEIKPNLIPPDENRRVVMRLTMSSVFAGSDKWLPVLP